MDTETKIAIGEIVKEWIAKSGFSQIQLAKDFGISQATLSQQLNGKRSIPPGRLKEMILLFMPGLEEMKKIKRLLPLKIVNQIDILSDIRLLEYEKKQESWNIHIADRKELCYQLREFSTKVVWWLWQKIEWNNLNKLKNAFPEIECIKPHEFKNLRDFLDSPILIVPSQQQEDFLKYLDILEKKKTEFERAELEKDKKIFDLEKKIFYLEQEIIKNKNN